MKNLKNVLAILFVSVIMCGCSNSDKGGASGSASNSGEGSASVVGTWKFDMDLGKKRVEAQKNNLKQEILEGSEAEWVFNEDGTGTEKAVVITEATVEDGVKYKTTINGLNTFKWHKDGSRLVIKITNIDKMTWDTEAICDNPRERAQWQNSAKEMSKEMTEVFRSAQGKEKIIADCNSNGSYDFEILELNDNRLEVKSAKGDMKDFDRVK